MGFQLGLPAVISSSNITDDGTDDDWFIDQTALLNIHVCVFLTADLSLFLSAMLEVSGTSCSL